jgi:hypothetical protein
MNAFHSPPANKVKQTASRARLLEVAFNTSMVAIAVMNAVTDEDGNITDFRIAIVNKEMEKQNGRSDLVGKLFCEIYPGVIDSGIFAAMAKVYQTGIPEKGILL